MQRATRSARWLLAALWIAGGTAAADPGPPLETRHAPEIAQNRVLGHDADGVPLVCGTDLSEPVARTASALTALPAETRSWESVPGVIRDDGVDSFNLEVDVNGPVNGVTLQGDSEVIPPEPLPLALHDDGLGADRIAGDSIYSAGPFVWNVASAPITTYMNVSGNVDGIAIREVGQVVVEETDATNTSFLIPPKVGGLRSDVPATGSLALSADVVVTRHVANVRSINHETQKALRSLPGWLAQLTLPIYPLVPDQVHFWILFSTNRIELLPQSQGSNFVVGRHRSVRRDYTGIGLNPIDNSGGYGSQRVLMSVNLLDAYFRGLRNNNATHELTHQWAAHVSDSLGLKSDSAHWAYASSAASLVGGTQWLDYGNGTYTQDCNVGRGGATHAPPLDRYLAGLIEGAEVPDLHVAMAVDCRGITYPEDIAITRTIGDIQALHGVRAPGPSGSQKDFAIGFIAESHERLLNETELTFYERLAEFYTREVADGQPAPYQGLHNWVSMTRYFEAGSSWRGALLMCGNGTLEFDEECDDGNHLGDDGCSELCVLPSPLLVGNVLVTDAGSDRVLAIDPLSGAQAVISESGSLSTPTDVVMESPDALLVVDRAAAAVLRIDASTGDQEIVASGDRLLAPRTLALEPEGTLLVGDATTTEIVRVDPDDGDQELVSTLGLLGEGFAPWSMDLDASSGDLFVAARFADAVVRVDPETGAAAPFSVGDLLSDPYGLAVCPTGPFVFDLDDWPSYDTLPPLNDDPFITDYDCDGKGFCSTNDVFDAAGFGGTLESIATTRAALTATFRRPDGELNLLAETGTDGHLDTSPFDDIPDDSPFRVEFSEPVGSASVEIIALFVEAPGPQAQFSMEAFAAGGGSPVASATEPASGSEKKTLSIDHPDGFSALEFRAFDPDYIPNPDLPSSAFLLADDLVVTTLPWIFVSDAGAAAVIQLDPRDGTQSFVAQGGLLSTPRGIAVSGSREIFVLDEDDEVIAIELLTGDQASVSQDGSLQSPRGIRVVPEPSRYALLAAGLALLAALHLRRRSRARSIAERASR